MKEVIHFKDINTPKYKIIMGTAILGLILAAVLFFLDATLYSSIFALISITLFYINSFDGFSTRNAVSYSLKSITVKLVGRKTFGFTFNELEILDLSEKGLYIKSKGMDPVTLSRKRYHDDSLEQLYIILKDKKTSHERR